MDSEQDNLSLKLCNALPFLVSQPTWHPCTASSQRSFYLDMESAIQHTGGDSPREVSEKDCFRIPDPLLPFDGSKSADNPRKDAKNTDISERIGNQQGSDDSLARSQATGNGRENDAQFATRAAVQRFKEKLSHDGDCVLWTGATVHNGYGVAWTGIRLIPAHRFAYQLYVGPIPDGLHLDHLCKNRRCCNPKHLQAVTLTENNRRSSATKLTEWDAMRIREMVASGSKHKLVAEMFGIHKASVSAIVRGKTWNNALSRHTAKGAV